MPFDDHTILTYRELPKNDALLLLEGALAHIQRYGWCQHDFFKGDKSCMYGALLRVRARHDQYDDSSFQKAYAALYNTIGGGSVVHWNDAQGRTQEEVETLLKSAINRVKAK